MKAWLFPFCNRGFKTTLKLFSDYKVEGQENIPRTGQVIFVANHISNLDPAIIAAASTRSPKFLAKKELFKFPLFSFLLKSYGAHPLDRGGSDVKAIRWAARHLRQENATLALFPEGTRDRKREGMRRGNAGVAQLAAITSVTIVPIGLTGSEPLQNVLRVLAPSAHLRLKVGTAFKINWQGDERPTRASLQSATDEIMVRVARLLPETYMGYYRDKVDMELIHTVDVPAGADPVAATA